VSGPGDTAGRLVLLKLLGLAAGLILAGRLVHIQVIEHPTYRDAAARQWLQAQTVAPRRGDLTDRHGRPLALTVSAFRVGVAGSLVRQPEVLATALGAVLEQSSAAVARALDRAGDRHVVLARQALLSPAERRRLQRFPAVTVDPQPGRVYPLDGVGASLIGFARQDPDSTRHRTALERGLDHLLTGRPGRALRVRSARAGRDHGLVEVEPVRDGADVTLTLDADLQEICESRLAEAVADAGARAGSVLVLAPATGDVLAAASWPLLETRSRPVADAATWINRNFTEDYEPGSVFKLFTAAALLAAGAVDTATVIDCSDRQFDGFRLSEAAGHEFGRLGFLEAFARSSNVWFARAVANLAPAEHHRALLDFGFGRGTGAPYPAEDDGMLAPPAHWSGRSQETLAIGQEVAVTPLQLGLATCAVANGGLLPAPRLWTEARGPDGAVVRTNPPRLLRRVLPPGLDAILRRALRRVVTDGTGAVVDRPWVAIGGKTGTAQKAVPGRGYRDGLYSATFAGMLPVEAPRLVIVAVLDEPRGIKHYASQSAAPLFGAVVDDIRRTTDWLTDVDRTSQPVVVTPPPVTVPAPDVLFLDAGHASRRLRQAGLSVRGATASGVVVAQVPAPGSRLEPGQTVTLTVRTRGAREQLCPDLRGLSNRQVQTLAARLGLDVVVRGLGTVGQQDPAPGAPLPAGRVNVTMEAPW
jgi:stage V sporulation protein D (sporulation-specific penicillin-binding protein)